MARRKNKRRKASKLERVAKATAVELRSGGSASRRGTVPQSKVYAPAKRGKERRHQSGVMLPGQLSSLKRELECGKPQALERWADLCEKITCDAHVGSVYDTRLMGVAGSPLVVQSGKPGDEIAERAAELFLESVTQYTTNFERAARVLANGGGVGWAALEHDWQVIGDTWHSVCPSPIAARDIFFDEDYTPHVRTFDVDPEQTRDARAQLGFTLGQSRGVSMYDERDRWCFHKADGHASVPTMTGYLLKVALPWLLKSWATVWQQDALERFASPRAVGTVPENTPQDVRDFFKECLEGWGAEGVAVLEQGTTIEVLESVSAADHWTTAIGNQNAEISKAILGSTLNVEIDKAGGNRAAAESQAATTILPRLQADANSLSETIERDWAEPWCRFNAHLFGGVIPPTPRVSFQLTQDEPPNITTDAINAGVVRFDEFRRAIGLDPVGPDNGGDEFIGQPVDDDMASVFDGLFESDEDETSAPVVPDENVQQSALNGAQVKSLLEIIASVAAGQIPRATGVQIIIAAFNMTPAQAEALMGDVGAGFTPEVIDDSVSAEEVAASDPKAMGSQLRALTAHSPTCSTSKTRVSLVPFDE